MKHPMNKLAAAVRAIGRAAGSSAGSRPLGALVLVAASMGAQAQQAQPSEQTLGTVDVVDFRGTQMDSPRYTRDLIDIPRIITILPNDLLEEQNATTLKDAMRNIPGISLQAGEGNPPGGDQLKIRGLNARDDINVNGMRDLGNYFRDPFFVDQLEIVKGPNSTYSGRGSAGGTINFVTKQPQQEAFSRFESGVGTDSYFRNTLDMNQPIDDNSALRINLMGHSSDVPGRDYVEEERYGLYAAYTWGFTGSTRITTDLLYTRQNDIPDAGLPMDRDQPGANANGTGKVPPGLDYSNYYGHVDDYKELDAAQLGLKIEHGFDNGVTLVNRTRLSQVTNDSITSSPRIRNITPDFVGSQVRGETKPRDQVDQGLTNQTDLLFNFATLGFEHDLVAGMELGHYTYENTRRPDVAGPLTDLYDPAPRFRPATPYDGTVYSYETKDLAFYLLDTIKLAPKWELNAGVRWDRVTARAWEQGRVGENLDIERTDSEVSYSAGLVHKLQPNLSLYGAIGTSFIISGNFDRNQVQLAGGSTARVANPDTFNTPPEKTRAYEVGAKSRLASGLDLSVALFRTETSNGRFPAQAGGDQSVVDTEYYINGLELLAAGNLTRDWRLYAGYAFLDSEVTASPSRSFAVGQELGGTPRNTVTVFTTYDLTEQLSVGGGVQYVDDQTSGVQASATGTVKVSIPSYFVADLYGAYRFNRQTQLRLNVYNVADEEYLSQVAEGGGQAIPGRGRQAIVTLRHEFY